MLNGYAITYEKKGQLSDVLAITEFGIDETNLQPHQMVLKNLASPVNPSDLVQIIGTYPSEPILRTLDNREGKKTYVGGNEGVFEVVHLGKEVSQFSVGDLLVPNGVSFGTWRSYALVDTTSEKFVKVDNSLSVEEAATISVNPPTAYEMFHNFVSDWKEGDWLVQNAGNSQVGQILSQIAKAAGVHVLSVVRDGKKDWELKELYDLGASKVVFESEFSSPDFAKKLPEITSNGNVRLAINAVGGSAAGPLVNALSHSGTLVTYGAISGDVEMKYSLGAQLFKNISTVPYWLSYNLKKSPESKKALLDAITKLYNEKALRLPKIQTVHVNGKLDEFKKALGSTKSLVKF